MNNAETKAAEAATNTTATTPILDELLGKLARPLEPAAVAKAAEAEVNTTTTVQRWNVDLSKLGIPPAPAAKPSDSGDRRNPLANLLCHGGHLAVAVLDCFRTIGAVNRWVLAALCSGIDCCGGAYTTHKALRKLTGYSESTIARALGCLARKGLVAWFRTPDDNEAHYIVNTPDLAYSMRKAGREELAGDGAVSDAVLAAIRAKCADLTPTEKWVLVAVARYETTGCSPTQFGVVRMTELKQSTVGKALASLERKGWVASCSVNEHRRGPRYIYKANMARIKAAPDLSEEEE